MDVKPLMKRIRVPKSEYLYRNLELLNVSVFPFQLNQSHLKVLEYFIVNGGKINSKTRKSIKDTFQYSSANLTNYLRELKKAKCILPVRGTDYKVKEELMKIREDLQPYFFVIEKETDGQENHSV
jgi:hypothetical protein